MRTFVCKETEMSNGPEAPVLNFGDLAVAVLNTPLKQGMKIEDIRQRTNLLNKFDGASANSEVFLEEAEYATLITAVEEMDWAVIHKDIVNFSDYLRDLKEDREIAE